MYVHNTVWPEISRDAIFAEGPSSKILRSNFVDVPELLHPQYLLGSASYCMHAASQITLEPAEKLFSKRSYLTLVHSRDREMAQKSHMIEAMVHGLRHLCRRSPMT